MQWSKQMSFFEPWHSCSSFWLTYPSRWEVQKGRLKTSKVVIKKAQRSVCIFPRAFDSYCELYQQLFFFAGGRAVLVWKMSKDFTGAARCQERANESNQAKEPIVDLCSFIT